MAMITPEKASHGLKIIIDHMRYISDQRRNLILGPEKEVPAAGSPARPPKRRSKPDLSVRVFNSEAPASPPWVMC